MFHYVIQSSIIWHPLNNILFFTLNSIYLLLTACCWRQIFIRNSTSHQKCIEWEGERFPAVITRNIFQKTHILTHHFWLLNEHNFHFSLTSFHCLKIHFLHLCMPPRSFIQCRTEKCDRHSRENRDCYKLLCVHPEFN